MFSDDSGEKSEETGWPEVLKGLEFDRRCNKPIRGSVVGRTDSAYV